MPITKGLIIDAPPIDRILAGTKTWEIRSSPTKVRGRVALIRKGTGMVVETAEIVGTVGPLNREKLLGNLELHQIAPDRIERGEVDKWRFGWVLQNAVKLVQPIRYTHPSGAVIWVNLDSLVTSQLPI